MRTQRAKQARQVVPVVVGIDNWQSVTLPFLASLWRYEDGAQIVLVDNRSTPPYPSLPDLTIVRTERRIGYPEALNIGIRKAQALYDPFWFLACNNDCLAQGSFFDAVAGLDDGTLWGTMNIHDVQANRELIGSGWLLISSRIWRTVGTFDERFVAGFEDFDYELRCEEMGFHLSVASIPLVHLEKHTRLVERRYYEKWNKSRLLFEQKHNYPTTEWPRKWFDEAKEKIRKA